jgi:sensor histidine kinase YesM
MQFKLDKGLLHLFFWVLYLLSQALIFMRFYEMENVMIHPETGEEIVTRTVFPENFFQALRAECVELPGKLLAVYVNLHALMPLLLFRRRLVAYLAMLTGLLALCAGLQYFLAKQLLLPLFFPGVQTGEGLFSLANTVRYAASCTSILVFTGAIRVVAHYFSEKNRAEELQTRQIQSELQQLKAQLNPHFLFNTLNNLYGLALERSEKTPGLLLRLSDIMSYLLHDAGAAELPVEKEIAMLRDLIELEKLRYGNRATVTLKVTGSVGGLQIPPLLLLPFVENAFKHGGSEQGILVVEARLIMEGNTLQFRIENNRSTEGEDRFKKTSGIGLHNVRERLQRLYPGRYTLQVNQDPAKFTVTLNINLS